jgi:hypothetical protein
VKLLLKLAPRTYRNKAKSPFEATRYEVYYVAANAADEQGKLDVALTLDRTTAWNCSKLHGSSTHYEFIGMPPTFAGKYQIAMRYLPCPCEKCSNYEFERCLNRDIVGDMDLQEMYEIAPVLCADVLTEPLTQYNKDVLQQFIKNNVERGTGPKAGSNKPILIEFIERELSELVQTAAAAAAAVE